MRADWLNRGRSSAPTGPEDAWRTLLLTVEWTKHAETKAATVLASAGVLGGLLYGLSSQVRAPAVAFVISAVLCAVTIALSAAAAGAALWPRMWPSSGSAGLMFFRSVSDDFGDDVDLYVGSFTALIADQASLRSAIARLVWASANVTARKFRASRLAVAGLLASFALLAVAAAFRLLSG